MKLKQIMTNDVEVVRPDETLQTAAQKMRERDIGFLPVCDGLRLVGALTDRDIPCGRRRMVWIRGPCMSAN